MSEAPYWPSSDGKPEGVTSASGPGTGGGAIPVEAGALHAETHLLLGTEDWSDFSRDRIREHIRALDAALLAAAPTSDSNSPTAVTEAADRVIVGEKKATLRLTELLREAANSLESCHEANRTLLAAPSAETIAGRKRDAERWRMLPAFLEKYQLDYVGLIRDIDAAIDAALAAAGGAKP